MPSVRVQLPSDSKGAVDWSALRRELNVTESFPPEVLAEAEQSAHAPSPPGPVNDRTDIPFFTLDPEGSRDLDQAMFLERTASGYRVSYAIADVAAFVRPGGALDVVTHERGQTLYCPDVRILLHPAVISEGAASLLPNETRLALVWTLDLDVRGELASTHVARASVRSVRQLDYTSVQTMLDADTDDEQLLLLREIGQLREERARDRDAVDLRTPEQVVTDGPDGRPVLSYRPALVCEAWNAQISLLTGIAAAQLMLDGKVGLLRTLPPPDSEKLASLRRSAKALNVKWADDEPYGDFVSSLDPADPPQAAMLNLSARLLRGAGYVAFDGEAPEQPLHSAVASVYAHCTAPLRRMADRYVGEICLALCAGQPVPQWVRDALPELPEEMQASDRRAHELERASVDLAEALVLCPFVGQTFDAVVVDVNDKGAMIQIAEPAVRARCEGQNLEPGKETRVRLVESDPAKRTVLFTAV